MIDLPAEAVQVLPVDELALLALQDLLDTAEWNEHNYLLAHPAPVNEAVAEALAWLRGRGFITRTPGKSAEPAIFVTAGGRKALARGLRMVRTVRAEEGLGQTLHPSIEQRSCRQFLLGEYEQAVFVAMKAVEVRVRRLAGFGDEVTGVDLMTRAFRPEGRLAVPAPSAESRWAR
ncbi:MAG: TIGR02391 family protein [Acidimicrobiales bacterium]